MPRARGAGVDCVMLLCEVYEAAGVLPHVVPAYYPIDIMMHRSIEPVLPYMERYGVEVDQPAAGDAVVYKFGRSYSHAAILVAPGRVIHSLRYVGQVLETGIEEGGLANRAPRFFTMRGDGRRGRRWRAEREQRHADDCAAGYELRHRQDDLDRYGICCAVRHANDHHAEYDRRDDRHQERGGKHRRTSESLDVEHVADDWHGRKLLERLVDGGRLACFRHDSIRAEFGRFANGGLLRHQHDLGSASDVQPVQQRHGRFYA